jgi:hypothetical protein
MIKFNFEKVVIGNSLDAVLYSHTNNLPLLLNSYNPPFRFDRSGKLDVYREVLSSLALSGLVPVSDKIQSIRIEDQMIKIITTRNLMVKVFFEELILFDDEKVYGLEPPREIINEGEVKVIHWITVNSGCKHSVDILETDDEFVNKIFFYKSERIGGNHVFKDAVTLSCLKEEEINDVEHSDIYVKYKVKKLMKEAGIRGTRNGKDVDNPEKFKYYDIRLDVARREIIELRKNIYDDTEFIRFIV